MSFRKVYSILAALALVPAAAAEVDFAKEVHPILVRSCTSCHTGEKAQGGLALNTRAEILRGGASGPSVVPGDSKASLFLQRITGDKLPRMPFGRDPLPASEIAILKQWIEEGAKGPAGVAAPRWVAPLRPRKPAPPSAERNPIDAFLHQVQGKTVTDNIYARRVYLDIWGLLPTPSQLHEFEEDRDPRKREKLVDQLLRHNDNYAGHWISFWNDLLRNEDGVVYYGERKAITAWLRRALEENTPYDRFVASLLNPAKTGDPEGYILGITWRGEVPAAELPPLQAAQNSAQTFLGINLKCNSCHDSFISSWKLKDAYGLASFFSPGPLDIVRCDAKTGEVSAPKFLFPELGKVKTKGSLQERRAEAARLFTMRDNGRLARTLVNRYWKILFGRGIVEPVDDMSVEPWNPDLLDALASDFADHDYDLKYLLRTLLGSRAYQLESVTEAPRPGERFAFRGPARRRLSGEQYVDAIASITGEWRYKPTNSSRDTKYVREWELKSTPLTRALGRPVRDQVVTDRLTQPTTLQAVELVNGRSLAEWLREAARRLAEAPPAPPRNLFDSGTVRRSPVQVDLPLKGVNELHLLVVNIDSYDAARVVPQWKDAVFVKGDEVFALQDLLKGDDPENLKLPARLIVNLEGKAFDRFQARVQVSKESTASDVGPAIRFFAFDREPDMHSLVRVDPRTPVETPKEQFTPDSLITRIYKHALQRYPSAEERLVARDILGAKLEAETVEDFLWMILQSPEFQYIL